METEFGETWCPGIKAPSVGCGHWYLKRMWCGIMCNDPTIFFPCLQHTAWSACNQISPFVHDLAARDNIPWAIRCVLVCPSSQKYSKNAGLQISRNHDRWLHKNDELDSFGRAQCSGRSARNPTSMSGNASSACELGPRLVSLRKLRVQQSLVRMTIVWDHREYHLLMLGYFLTVICPL